MYKNKEVEEKKPIRKRKHWLVYTDQEKKILISALKKVENSEELLKRIIK